MKKCVLSAAYPRRAKVMPKKKVLHVRWEVGGWWVAISRQSQDGRHREMREENILAELVEMDQVSGGSDAFRITSIPIPTGLSL